MSNPNCSFGDVTFCAASEALAVVTSVAAIATLDTLKNRRTRERALPWDMLDSSAGGIGVDEPLTGGDARKELGLGIPARSTHTGAVPLRKRIENTLTTEADGRVAE